MVNGFTQKLFYKGSLDHHYVAKYNSNMKLDKGVSTAIILFVEQVFYWLDTKFKAIYIIFEMFGK